MQNYKLPLFAGNVVHFYGFDAFELRHMQEVILGYQLLNSRSSSTPEPSGTTPETFFPLNLVELPKNMQVLVANGGRVAGGEDSADMTHLVIEDNSVEVTPELLNHLNHLS